MILVIFETKLRKVMSQSSSVFRECFLFLMECALRHRFASISVPAKRRRGGGGRGGGGRLGHAGVQQ